MAARRQTLDTSFLDVVIWNQLFEVLDSIRQKQTSTRKRPQTRLQYASKNRAQLQRNVQELII